MIILIIISSPPINSYRFGDSFKKIIESNIPETGTSAVNIPAIEAFTFLRPLNHRINDMYVKKIP